jgi:hypothetical protein
MRVATLFTGVTACAAAFAPAANAQATTNVTNKLCYSSAHVGNNSTRGRLQPDICYSARPPVCVTGPPGQADLEACWELGALVAAELAE